MPLSEQTAYGERFNEQLSQLRENIETLPETERPHFRSLADQAEQHRRTMEGECAKMREAIGDMRLNEASVKFNMWALAKDIRRMFAEPNRG